MHNRSSSGLLNSGYGQRIWLKTRGKQKFIPFTEKEMSQLRKYFDSLDQQGSGSIGLAQFQDPFIAFGICQTRNQVLELIESVDQDGSGKIEFNEFLNIMLKIKRQGKQGRAKNLNQNSRNAAIYKFFDKLQNGNLDNKFNRNISFKLNVSQFRRKKLLDSMMSKSKEQRQAGLIVMNNFKMQVLQNTKTRDFFNFSKNSNVVDSNIKAIRKFTSILN